MTEQVLVTTRGRPSKKRRLERIGYDQGRLDALLLHLYSVERSFARAANRLSSLTAVDVSEWTFRRWWKVAVTRTTEAQPEAGT